MRLFRKARNGRRQRGSLTIVALFLFASAAIRIGTEAGQAIARETVIEPSEKVTSDSGSAPMASCKTPEELQAMLDLFAKRDSQLSSLEDELQIRTKALSIAEEHVTRKLNELEVAEESLRATMALASTAAEEDLLRLTEVYETMKPKDAAALFEEMESGFAAGFLGRMRPDAAAEIMAGLSPASAYSISVIMAGRNAKVPTE